MTITPAVATPVAMSCAEGRYDCGHISRSSSRAVKRALFLHLAEVEDLGYLGSRTEPVEVLAALTLMRQGAECREILEAGDPQGVMARMGEQVGTLDRDLTPEQIEVLRYVAQGYSYPEIAAATVSSKGTPRKVETVRSLVKAAMRATLTHNATDAAVEGARQGLL
jgi:DNA-binding NarL/FixJ family response regulator